MLRVSICLLLAVSLCLCREVERPRSKRQLSVYYMCGSYPNSYVSTTPCSGVSNGCGSYNNCNNMNTATTTVIPNNFYNPYCNSGCSNLNCNNYNGQNVNGQYVAYNYASNQYSPCASSCCNNYNNNNNGYAPYNNNYNPLVYTAPGPVVGGYVNNMGSTVVGGNVGTGYGQCGGGEAPVGQCSNGLCPTGSTCVAGNSCCKCAIGISGGSCFNGGCAAGYSCTQYGQCCASAIWRGNPLDSCVNGRCPDGFVCGVSDLCYPSSYKA